MFSKRNGECSLWQWIGFFILFVSVSMYINWFDASIFFSGFYSVKKPIISNSTRTEYPMVCSTGNQTETSPAGYPTTHYPLHPYHPSCPSYYRWIHEDLRPWKEAGITKDMVEQAGKYADFRLVIVDGKAYVVKYRGVFQTRDVFTLWGILQLLRWYPGRLPDLDLMFECGDSPRLQSRHFQGPNAQPPPLFRYCSQEGNLDIVFPDWTFWGWAETNIRPWRDSLKDIKEGSKRIKWKDRVPYAYYRGNLNIARTRKDLRKCNSSGKHDWNTHLYMQDWKKERRQGFKESNLADQCTHRYKIYIEGRAWSVSEKYILACDSMTLYVKSHYYDFFSRELQPLKHYWPVRDDAKCPSLKFAVEWGNNHPEMAVAIGEAAAKFMEEELRMEYVYDYMFHLLTGYAKLLKFKPEVPKEAVELSPETMACRQSGNWKKYMEESLVTSPSETVPCAMPLPFGVELQEILDDKANATRQVEMWENEFWKNMDTKQ